MAEPIAVRAALVDGDVCKKLALDDGVKAFKSGHGMLWMHVEAKDVAAARELLEETLGFHELAVEDSLSTAERPSLQEFPDFLFLSVPVLAAQQKRERFVEMGFFLTESALVTVGLKPFPLVDAWYEKWLKRPGPIGHSPGALLHSIVDAIVDDFFPALESVEDQMEDLSDLLLRGSQEGIQAILPVKRRLLHMRRQLAPLRDVLNSLLRKDVRFVPVELRPYFQDVLDHVLRLYDILETNRETLASIIDIQLTATSNGLNEVMKKMTVIATVLMTMSWISGVYGMNFVHMPELGWAFGYPFAIALMLAGAALVLWAFKRQKWI